MSSGLVGLTTLIGMAIRRTLKPISSLSNEAFICLPARIHSGAQARRLSPNQSAAFLPFWEGTFLSLSFPLLLTRQPLLIPHLKPSPPYSQSHTKQCLVYLPRKKLRVGYPELCPAPCRAVQFQEGLQIQVDDLTSLLDLKVISITTIGRVHLLDTDQTIQPTLLVTVRNTDPEGEKWGEKAKNVHETLCQEGLPGLMVEIAGEEFDRLPSYTRHLYVCVF